MSDSSDYMTCEVCHCYEICLITEPTGTESGLYSCEEGHVFCKDCFPEFHDKALAFEQEQGEYHDEVPAQECPICQKQYVRDEDILEYLLEKMNVTKEEIVKEIQGK